MLETMKTLEPYHINISYAKGKLVHDLSNRLAISIATDMISKLYLSSLLHHTGLEFVVGVLSYVKPLFFARLIGFEIRSIKGCITMLLARRAL